MRDYAAEAQQAAEAHIDACDASLVDVPGEETPESPSEDFYDGCATCQVRETLRVAWPIAMEANREQLLTALDGLSEENATGSRDFGRGYAMALRDLRAALQSAP